MDALARLALDIASGRIEGLDLVFREDGAPPPRLIWNPAPEDLSPPVLGRLLEYWRSLRGTAEFPAPRAVDPAGMRFILGSLALVDVVEGGSDFTYRLYGTRIAAWYGRDMTGRRVSEFGGRPTRFYLSTYRAVLMRRQPLFTEHVPSRGPVSLWRRLTLPLAAPDGTIVRFLVANIADGDLAFAAVPGPRGEPGG